MKKLALQGLITVLGAVSIAHAGDQITGNQDLTCECGAKLGKATVQGNGQIIDYDDLTGDNQDMSLWWDFGTQRYEDADSAAYISFDVDEQAFVLYEPDGEKWEGTYSLSSN